MIAEMTLSGNPTVGQCVTLFALTLVLALSFYGLFLAIFKWVDSKFKEMAAWGKQLDAHHRQLHADLDAANEALSSAHGGFARIVKEIRERIAYHRNVAAVGECCKKRLHLQFAEQLESLHQHTIAAQKKVAEAETPAEDAE